MKKTKKKNLREKGVTLVALVVTIIVLLILAGVTISTFYDSGILIKSEQTVKIYNKEALKEFASSKSEFTRLEEESKLSDKELLDLALEYLENGYNQRYKINKYDKLVAESVVIIKDAISQGIDYKILNEEKSVVEFSHKGKKEFVIEGNKTDRDS